MLLTICSLVDRYHENRMGNLILALKNLEMHLLFNEFNLFPLISKGVLIAVHNLDLV